MRRKLRAARRFTRRDWWLFFQAWVLLLVFDLGLQVLPFRRIRELVARGRKGAGQLEADQAAATIRYLQWLVGVAGRNHLHRVRCLPRALVLQWLLGRRGIGADLRIGVRKEADGLDAHAWLEYGGQPIGEPQAVSAQFAPLLAGGTNQ